MGCTLSKLDNEDTVRCCKERLRLMTQAVHARHRLAAAHSNYCRSLRHAGVSLSAFSAAEPSFALKRKPEIGAHSHSLPYHSPPQSHQFSRSASLRHHNPAKLPRTHTLPHSSHSKKGMKQTSYDDPVRNSLRTYSRASSVWNWDNLRSPSPLNSRLFQHRNKSVSDDHRPNPQSYENSDSHFSMDWNDYSDCRFPADADPQFYENTGRRNSGDSNSLPYQHHRSDPKLYRKYNRLNLHDSNSFSDECQRRPDPKFYKNSDRCYSPVLNSYSHNNLYQEDLRYYRNSNCPLDSNSILRRRENGDLEEREDDVHCSEWSSTSTTSSGDDDVEEGDEIGSRSEFGSSVQSVSEYRHMGRNEKSGDGASSSVRWKSGLGGGCATSRREVSDFSIVVSRKDFKEIALAIKEQFFIAADAGEKMSDILETGRAQLDQSFGQLRKTLYHSSDLLSKLSSSWMSKPPLEIKYQLDMGSLVESGGTKSLCTSLERLLAWEKKLYREVKARERAKIEHEKKLAILQSQEHRRLKGEKVDKTKASIKKIHSIITVTSQAVSTTTNAINSLKDAYLVPQLIGLCHALKYTWKSMNESHEAQTCIVQQVQSLVTRLVNGEATSDTQRHHTRGLQSAISTWHSAFTRLIKYQKDLIHSLHAWFKLTIIPISKEDNSIHKSKHSEVVAFLDEWKLGFYRIPDTVASEAIKSLSSIVEAIYIRQGEELKIKKRAEKASKELERKASSVRHLEMKFYRSYSLVSPPGGEEGRDEPLVEKKMEVERWRRKAEAERVRHLKAAEATKVMTLNNIQSGLPGVFRAMAGFSAVFVEAMEAVCTASYAIE